MKIEVRNNDVDSAARRLKRRLQKEGLLGELRRRIAYEKPSARRRRKHAEAVRRSTKQRRDERD